MTSIYLQENDYATYGAPATTTEAQVIAASATIKGYLSRPEGLLWGTDGNGNPCYMQELADNVPYTVTVTSGGISPGTNVIVNVTGPAAAVSVGKVLILDRANPNLTEAVIVSDIQNNQMTLASVQFSHDANALLEFDLSIVEEIDAPDGRQEFVMSRTPVAYVLSGQGQLGYPRRGSAFKFNYNFYSLLPAVAKFGGPPIWQTFPTPMNAVDVNTGRIWVSMSIYLSYYTQVRLYYMAGYTYSSLPSAIKQACANILNSQNALSSIGLNGPITDFKQGDTQIKRAANTANGAFSYIDADTQKILNPFKARSFR